MRPKVSGTVNPAAYPWECRSLRAFPFLAPLPIGVPASDYSPCTNYTFVIEIIRRQRRYY